MSKNLIIVESPNKVKKIQSFLSSDYNVIASVGHIRDLKKYGTRYRLGIDLDEMDPLYLDITDKKKVIKEINKEAKKAENIFLATDPDREGEAIAWHINEVIDNKDNKNIYRITFNEITKQAVESSINNPNKINMDLVKSQETRRMLDRIIGFRLSYITNKKIKAPSAGRVKSSALKLIIDREEEIKKFVPVFWWTIEGEISKKIKLINTTKDFKNIEYPSKEEADEVLKNIKGDFNFIERKTKKVSINTPEPLEMATLLMGLFNEHGMSNEQVTFISQSLYEKGLITYPRTDSKRISSLEFIEELNTFVKDNYGEENLVKEKQIKKSSKKSNVNSQDAHEAIRPTDVKLVPDFDAKKIEDLLKELNSNERKVYSYIWRTTVKSFMVKGENISVNDLYENNTLYFKIQHSYVSNPGFRLVDGVKEEKEPKIEKQIKLDLKNVLVVEHSTKPPARYNQSSIIKKLKDEGIGRPSTYSATTSGLIKHNYLLREKGVLIPTDLAFEVNNLLLSKFSDIINEKYTASMEDSLDYIANGDVNNKEYLKDFWREFEPRIEDADKTIEVKLPEFVGRKCPLDGGDLVYKRSRYGKFIGCINYPDCKYNESLEEKFEPIKLNDIKCPNCGSVMEIKKSRYNTYFIGCSNFPKCKTIMPKKEAEPIINENMKD